MGTYVQNYYNITIPAESIGEILAQWDSPSWQGPYPVTPEGIVELISDEFGRDDELPEYVEEDGTVHIQGWSYGKLGDADKLALVLKEHGVTGIIHGEADDFLFLTEFTEDGEVKEHVGQVVFPTYTGGLYS